MGKDSKPKLDSYLCAFSSNSRELYLSDIYRVLSLPDDSIIQFRYKKKYVDNDIIESLDSIENKDVLLFFTNSVPNYGISDSYPIRKAKVMKVEYSEQTQLVHLFMSLTNFIDIDFSGSKKLENFPNDKYLTRIKLESPSNDNWTNKILQVQNFLKEVSFFYLKEVRSSRGTKIQIKHSSDLKRSFYKLKQGAGYLLDVSLANPNENDSMILFESSADDVSFNTTNPLPVNAHLDDRLIPLYLKSLNVSSEHSFISIAPTDDMSDADSARPAYRCNIEVEKNISTWSAILFGLSSSLAIISVWGIKVRSSSLDEFNINFDVDFMLYLYAVVLLVCSAYLFYKFNKK